MLSDSSAVGSTAIVGVLLFPNRAHEVAADALAREEALASLGATRRAVESDLAQAMSSSSLCHGLAGNADILLFGASLEAGVTSGYPSLAARAADRVLRDVADPSQGWSGTGPRPQGLMLGMAGAGYLGLRVIRPATPTLLLPGVRAEITSRPSGNSRPAMRLSGG
jgi:hypothetical protein